MSAGFSGHLNSISSGYPGSFFDTSAQKWTYYKGLTSGMTVSSVSFRCVLHYKQRIARGGLPLLRGVVWAPSGLKAVLCFDSGKFARGSMAPGLVQTLPTILGAFVFGIVRCSMRYTQVPRCSGAVAFPNH